MNLWIVPSVKAERLCELPQQLTKLYLTYLAMEEYGPVLLFQRLSQTRETYSKYSNIFHLKIPQRLKCMLAQMDLFGFT